MSHPVERVPSIFGMMPSGEDDRVSDSRERERQDRLRFTEGHPIQRAEFDPLPRFVHTTRTERLGPWIGTTRSGWQWYASGTAPAGRFQPHCVRLIAVAGGRQPIRRHDGCDPSAIWADVRVMTHASRLVPDTRTSAWLR